MSLNLKTIQEELRRRSIWQVVVGYAVGAVGVLGIVDLASDLIGLPDWVLRFSFLICLVALPLVLATAIVQKTALRDELPSEVAPAKGLRRWLTWRPVLVTVVGAFALLVAGTVGYLGLRAGGVGPAASLITGGYIEEHSVLVLADFVGTGGAEDLARTVNQGVREEFLQSRVVTLAGPGDLGPILQLMEKPPDAPLDLSTAREVAVRGGMPAVIHANIDGEGIEGYIFTASIVSPESGELLAGHQVPTSGDAHEIMAAIDRLSKVLREEIGESYRDLRGSKPLPEVTTQSLEALQKYAAAFEAEDEETVEALLQEAVTIDSTFAMAWRRLGTLLGTQWLEPARVKQAYSAAFRHSERLPDREKYKVQAMFHRNVAGDPQKAIEAWETQLELFPDDRNFNDYSTRYNLGVTYRDASDPVGRLDRAEEVFREALRLYSTPSQTPCGMVGELTAALWRQGKLEEAKETRRAYGCEESSGDLGSALMAAAEGNYSEAEAELVELVRTLEETGTNLGRRALALGSLAGVFATQGRLTEAEARAREILTVQADLEESHLDIPVMWAGLQLRVRKDTVGALSTLERALAPFSTGDRDPRKAPLALWSAAEVYARAGRLERARDLLLQLDSFGNPHIYEFPEAYAHVRGLLALREGRLDEALREFQASEVGGECPILCAAPGLAETYEAMGQADSALAVYERYITTPYLQRLFKWDQYFLPYALERTGQLHDQRGDREKAVEYYGRFVELWAGADPEFQPRVEAARRRLEELGGG